MPKTVEYQIRRGISLDQLSDIAADPQPTSSYLDSGLDPRVAAQDLAASSPGTQLNQRWR